ncbi:MAG: protein-L-isoaspartate(D-aspartate) O-methyltransferase [Pelagibacteraceae bacterium]|jgi:protein-L-isoaspartate(D-aspartate) O-methyltransferase|nr:protein-L-isoaspartate(D-aspartate) O-methyltransferase [Pelagibacteraceae bacterium]|tara:strand:+ start:94 stop:720 length:627 start_codon:yes stop_codon:yes gene_type:complete
MLDNKDLIRELKIEGISDKNILRAIEKVPREFFVAQGLIDRAYENIPLPIDCGQTISQPYVVAYMISCLKLKKTDKVLEIGTGTGYQTAILSYLCKEVCTIEIYNKLLDQAKKRILKLNLKNINFILGNGTEGWNAKVLFDAIIVSAASEIIPDKLLKNLKNHGCLIMPKKKSLDIQKLLLIKKSNETYLEKELCSVKFVPLLNDNIE